MSEIFYVVKLGVNYKFGEDRKAHNGGLTLQSRLAGDLKSGWEIGGGVRYRYSSGKFQWDNAQKAAPSTN